MNEVEDPPQYDDLLASALLSGTPWLVGICGLKQSGKSTASRALVDDGYCPDSFADDLKSIIGSVRGMSVEVPAGEWKVSEDIYLPYQTVVDGMGLDEAKERVPDVRRILQTFGTEGMRRAFGPDVWLDRVLSRAVSRVHEGLRTVVADVRFPNEAAAIKEAGGVLIRVVRPGQEAGHDLHTSETQVMGLEVDAEILNDSTIDDLRRKTMGAVRGLYCPPGRVPGVLEQPLGTGLALALRDGQGFLSATVAASLPDIAEAIKYGQSGGDDEHCLLASEVCSALVPHDSAYEVVGTDPDGSLLVGFTTNVGAVADLIEGMGA